MSADKHGAIRWQDGSAHATVIDRTIRGETTRGEHLPVRLRASSTTGGGMFGQLATLGFAVVGLIFVLVFRSLPPPAEIPIQLLIYWVCPAGVALLLSGLIGLVQSLRIKRGGGETIVELSSEPVARGTTAQVFVAKSGAASVQQMQVKCVGVEKTYWLEQRTTRDEQGHEETSTQLRDKSRPLAELALGSQSDFAISASQPWQRTFAATRSLRQSCAICAARQLTRVA